MNLFRLGWKNVTFKPLSMMLSIVLFALGVGLISLLFLLEDQLQKNFEKNLGGIDLVVGAKGSPLQLILCSMYHIDAPTGNISLQEARPFLNPKHPIIEQSVPLSLGDSYRGYRIVGTTQDILGLYEATIDQGKIWERNFEVTLGASVAQDLNLTLGSEFKSSHGFMDDADMAHDDAESFKVVGILNATGTVVDQLILTTNQSFWLVHDHGAEESTATSATEEDSHDDHAHDDHDHDGHDHDDHDHAGHDHNGHDHDDHDHDDHDHAHDDHDHDGHDHDGHDHDHASEVPKSLLEEDPEKEITSLLLTFKGHNFQALNMQRNINENTDLQAATPAIEINRIYAMMNSGERALRILAVVIIFVSALSIFISLFNSLKERKYELALMRVMGATRTKLFSLITLEGLILAVLGSALGILLSHGGMQLFAGNLKEQYRYDFSGFEFLWQEGYLLIGALLIGFLAALLPAIQASRTDISEVLQSG